MKVMIDATTALGQTGVATYGRNLIDAILALDTGIDFTLVFMGNLSQCPETWRKKARIVGTDRPWVRKLVLGPGSFLNVLWPRSWPQHFDVYHSLENFLPNIARRKGLVTIHDINRPTSFLKRRLVNSSINKACHIIAVSQHTKNHLLEATGKPEATISVVYHGTPSIAVPPDPKAVLAAYSVPEPFILYVGGLSLKGRNLKGLATAYSRLRTIHKLPHTLVLAGPIEPDFERAFSEIRKAAKGEPVVHLGYVEEGVKGALYSSATMLVSPSLLEGFGLTLLEAMSAGCPVITSSTTSCPEVAGDAAILVDPEDDQAIMNAMLRVIGDEQLRKDMKTRGLQRARQFTWGRAAQQTIKVYNHVAALCANERTR